METEQKNNEDDFDLDEVLERAFELRGRKPDPAEIDNMRGDIKDLTKEQLIEGLVGRTIPGSYYLSRLLSLLMLSVSSKQNIEYAITICRRFKPLIEKLLFSNLNKKEKDHFTILSIAVESIFYDLMENTRMEHEEVMEQEKENN